MIARNIIKESCCFVDELFSSYSSDENTPIEFYFKETCNIKIMSKGIPKMVFHFWDSKVFWGTIFIVVHLSGGSGNAVLVLNLIHCFVFSLPQNVFVLEF